ncbi:3-methyladenine DNA glycosylase AlkD [Corynebacterium pollutisoli]|uniref:3-methyladenine DNA glycosylase AlkD n=1 Tax=Corynebacterium pollutisoli TaxID=1610489 RepID=A0A1X7JUY6_9CORY|nr:DNA alkylation repair protein [Corynebacterium pollutisoli]SMG32004.1 3-methyladenine DNA glycosylase AlkD [Corynebacterium pollutisoli]
MSVDLIESALRPLADPGRAAGMAAYMRDQFPFLGVATPARRRAVRGLLPRTLDRDLVDALWSLPEREFQYVACDHLQKVPLESAAADFLRSLVVRKSWWDTVDALAKPVGRACTPEQMRAWARDDNLWVRRAAVLHQLGRREATDAELLGEILAGNLDSGEFFLDKAVGWALREYSKTDPAWVRTFRDEHEMAALTRREASKYL